MAWETGLGETCSLYVCSSLSTSFSHPPPPPPTHTHTLPLYRDDIAAHVVTKTAKGGLKWGGGGRGEEGINKS